MERQKFVQLYGGIVVEVPDESFGEQAARTLDQPSEVRRSGRRKVSKGFNGEDEDKKGKRGRPRVDPQDQSAAERRRTQIRLAQRAYRERKETTISELEQRVVDLQQTVSSMNQAFLGYNQKALSLGIVDWNPELGAALNSTIQHFFELARNANVDSDAGQPRTCGGKMSEAAPSHESNTVRITNHDQRKYASAPLRTSSLPNLNYPASMLGYDYNIPDAGKNNYAHNDDRVEELHDYQDTRSLGYKWIYTSADMQPDYAEVSPLPVPTPAWIPTVDDGLKPTWTYSFQESTFSRRLLRSSSERAYYLLTNPNAPKCEVDRVFRFTFHLYDIQKIATGLRKRLMKSNKESLEKWNVPLLHVGGAGLHFPRVVPEDEDPLPVNWNSLQSVGPHQPENAEVTMCDENFPYKAPECANVEGEWFDSNDVEQYLRAKGLYLDGQMSVAEIEVEDQVPSLVGDFMVGSPSSLSSESFVDPQSPRNTNDTVPGLILPSTDFFYRDSSRGQLPTTFDGIAMDAENTFTWPGEANLKSTDAFHMNGSDMFPDLATFDFVPHKRKVRIDVEKLLEALNEKSICLGRAPGFRRGDVDAALRKVLQEAF
ncbi:hypothetical protein MMC26_007003 [Xylographa opegraphella]|nr:hypothetical protein [Xylographa opegraphella]